MCREVHSKVWVPFLLCPVCWLRIFSISPLVKSIPSPTCLFQVSSCSLLFVPLLRLYLGPESVFLSVGCSPRQRWSLLVAQGFGSLQVHSHLSPLSEGAQKVNEISASLGFLTNAITYSYLSFC